MKFIKSLLSFFCTITTAIVFIININFLTVDYTIISKHIMLHILLASFTTALVTAIFFSFAEKYSHHLFPGIVGTILHFLSLCAVMFVFGVLWFGWFELSFEGILSMVISVAIVYVIVYGVSYILMKREADELNRALKERTKEN